MKKGVINIVSLLLAVLMVLAVASGMYFWFSKIQSESQQTATQYNEETLSNVLTGITIVDDAVYNTLAEDKNCLPATMTLAIQNTGASKLKINNDSEIIVSNANGPFCLSTFTGTCTSPEDRLYVARQNSGQNANISYSTDGTTWVSADDSVGTLDFLSSIEFNENLYFGGHYLNPLPHKGAKVFRSCDFETWSVDFSIPEATRVYALEVFGDNLYASTSSLVGQYMGHIYKLETNTSWSLVHVTTEDEVRGLEVFDGYIYAATAFNGNLSRSSDGQTWENVSFNYPTIDNITAIFANEDYLFIGTDSGEDDAKIYRSANGVDFTEERNTPGDAVISFGEFNGDIYAGTNSSEDANIYRSTDNGDSWSGVYDSTAGADFNDSINSFAVLNNKIYAFMSGASGGAILESSTGDVGEWSIAYSEDDSATNFTTAVNYTYCNNEKVSCLRGCDSNMVPGETRTIELQLENTDCDISDFSTTTDYSFRINFGSAASVLGRFDKKVISTTNSDSPCEFTYPLCNGEANCAGGTCVAAPFLQTCMCIPTLPCEAVCPEEFDCSIGDCTAEGGTCTFQAGEGICECV